MKNMYNALNMLYSRAHKQMTADELETLGSAFRDSAISIAQDTSTVLEGIACLISSENDAHEKGVQVSGSLQHPDSIFQTLCMAAAKFDLIAGMIEVGNEAKYHANERKEAAK